MERRLALALFSFFLLQSPAGTALAEPLADPFEHGPYAVGHASFTVADPRGRVDYSGNPYTLLVEAFYPVDAEDAAGPDAVYDFGDGLLVTSTDIERAGFPRTLAEPPVSSAGPFPLVIMGGGDFGTRSSDHLYTNFTLASHGFKVLAPARVGETLWKTTMLDRLKDISLLIDAVEWKNADASDPFHGAINVNEIAVGGWSLGGFVAYGIAGGYTDKYDARDEYDPYNTAGEVRETIAPDERVKAIIALDGSASFCDFIDSYSCVYENVTERELARIEIPALIMGEHHAVIGDLFNLRPHEQISAKSNYLVEIKGSRHGSFGSFVCGSILVLQANPEADQLLGSTYGDLLSNVMLSISPECGAGSDPLQPGVDYIGAEENIRLLNLYMVSFLKRHLGSDERYNRYLNQGYAVSNGLAVDFYKKSGM